MSVSDASGGRGVSSQEGCEHWMESAERNPSFAAGRWLILCAESYLHPTLPCQVTHSSQVPALQVCLFPVLLSRLFDGCRQAAVFMWLLAWEMVGFMNTAYRERVRRGENNQGGGMIKYARSSRSIMIL